MEVLTHPALVAQTEEQVRTNSHRSDVSRLDKSYNQVASKQPRHAVAAIVSATATV